MRYPLLTVLAAAIATVLAAPLASASSHREAPFVTEHPKVDGADFYMFRSYEAGRDGYVTLVADYIPLENPGDGPNYYTLDPNALYEIHIDNNGDAKEDLTFQFRFTNTYNNAALTVGGKSVPVPLELLGPIGSAITSDDANKNLVESYEVTLVRGDRRTGEATKATNGAGGTTFRKPLDNIGQKSIPDYAAYAAAHIASIGIPGCEAGKVFVGQRQDPFFVNLGEIFDLVNLNPVGPPNAEPNSLARKQITSIELEVPVACLAAGGSPIIGGWTTASMRQARVLNPAPKGVIAGATATQGPEVVGGAWSQVSRLGMPLVNEVVIGLPDKDRFNASQPRDDAQFLDYVTNPTLPALLQVLFPTVTAPTVFPRTDLVSAFLTGVDGLNKPAGVVPSEMLRLNTSIAPKAAAAQDNLGVLGGDTSGFPNGRRPGDDIVDITLRVAMGALLPADQAPSGQLPFTDQTSKVATDYPEAFPYLLTPLPGSPNSANGQTQP